jgi:hypothetical protein
MNQNNIVQFVGFITSLEFDNFIQRWEYYVKLMKEKKMKNTLQKQHSGKNRYRYISQHAGSPEDFKFAFMKKRDSEHFPEHNAKVVHIGGYTSMQQEATRNDRESNLNLMLFVKNPEADLEYYRHLAPVKKLNIYQAYFENCAYAYILEFFVAEEDATALISILGTRESHTRLGDELAIYEEYALTTA